MSFVNTTQRRDRLTADELAAFESQLAKEGYRPVAKASEGELLPGEYLKRQRSTYVYAYASPVAWEVVWCDRAGGRTRTPRSTAVHSTRR